MMRAAMTVLLLAGAGLPAGAPALDSDQPVRVQAERIEVDRKTMTSRYHGHVVVEQAGSRIEADRATVIHRDRGVEHLTAAGSPVRFFHTEASGATMRGEAGAVEYDAAEDRVRLSGAVRVERDGDRLEGERIEYFRASGRIEAGDGRARVSMTLTPRTAAERQGPGP